MKRIRSQIGKWKRKPVRIQRVYSCNNYERPIDQRPAVPRIVTNVDWQNSLSLLWPEACVCVWWKYLSRWCIFYRFTNISWKETFKLFCWYMNITSLECQAALTLNCLGLGFGSVTGSAMGLVNGHGLINCVNLSLSIFFFCIKHPHLSLAVS